MPSLEHADTLESVREKSSPDSRGQNIMQYPNASYVKDDINGQFGAVERRVVIDGKTYEIDLQDRNFQKVFETVLTKGRLVSQ